MSWWKALWRPRVPMTASIVAIMTGCIYIPTAEHEVLEGRNPIASEDAMALTPMQTTRADVLLRFGPPEWRTGDDRVFAYMWTLTQGYVVVGAGYEGGVLPVPSAHLLMLEFDDSGTLQRARPERVGVDHDLEPHIERWLASDRTE